jgi:Flp pilus assembly protein TadB
MQLFVRHSLECVVQYAQGKHLYDVYHQGEAFVAAHSQCTGAQSNLGLLYVALVPGLIAFVTTVWRDHEDTNTRSEMISTYFAALVLAIGATMLTWVVAFVALADMDITLAVLGVISVTVALFDISTRLKRRLKRDSTG